MGLLSSLFSRTPAAGGVAGEVDAGDNVAQARTRARQRLMGAVVLVGAGIIGFPLLFETQPRPIAVDVPIEIPPKENAAPLTAPIARAPLPKAPLASTPESTLLGDKAEAVKAAPEIITETAAEAGLTTPGKAPVAQIKPTAKPVDSVETRADAKPDKAAPKSTPSGNDAARAQALLEGKPAAAAAASAQRFIVQIGAFADPALAQQTRLKVERLGLVTYTHVAQTADGARTRVRVGPVPTRQEADKVAAKLKAAGLPAAILTL